MAGTTFCFGDILQIVKRVRVAGAQRSVMVQRIKIVRHVITKKYLKDLYLHLVYPLRYAINYFALYAFMLMSLTKSSAIKKELQSQ